MKASADKGPHWSIYLVGLVLFIGIFGCGQVWRVPGPVIDMVSGGSQGHYHELEILWNESMMGPAEYRQHLDAVANLVAKGDDELLKSFISLGLHCDGAETGAYESALGDLLADGVSDARLSQALTGFRAEARATFKSHLVEAIKPRDLQDWPQTRSQLEES